jgi:hypothetical protein
LDDKRIIFGCCIHTATVTPPAMLCYRKFSLQEPNPSFEFLGIPLIAFYTLAPSLVRGGGSVRSVCFDRARLPCSLYRRTLGQGWPDQTRVDFVAKLAIMWVCRSIRAAKQDDRGRRVRC